MCQVSVLTKNSHLGLREGRERASQRLFPSVQSGEQSLWHSVVFKVDSGGHTEVGVPRPHPKALL